MLDWKKLQRSPQQLPAAEVEKALQDPVTRRPFNLRGWQFVLLVLVLLYLLATLVVGWFWSREPDLFSVEQNVREAAARDHREVAPGYTTVETVKTVAGTLLHKSGGYLSNDVTPPGVWLDNMQSWEYGVLVQVRDITRALRRDFARSQSQSTEDPDLANAEPHFNYDNKKWILPGSEAEYQRGIQQLDDYEARLNMPGDRGSRFYARADNLNNWLGDVSTRLGSLSQRLSASVGRVPITATLAEDQANVINDQGQDLIKTPWLLIDNVVYEARGQAWALSHFLRAVEVDFADVLAKKNATVSLQQIIRELEATQEPIWSPMILNGDGFGLLANHSLVMANYISRANAAIIDLRNLLNQG